MAYLSKPSKASRGAVVHTPVKAGFAMVAVNDPNESLPVAELAAENDTFVYVGLIPPDNFSRPTLDEQYQYKTVATRPVSLDGEFIDPVERGGGWLVGKSVAYNPTMQSGERIGLHRGCTVTVPSGCYVDSADIRKRETLIRVGTGGKWTAAASSANAVGTVDHFDDELNELTLILWR